VVGSGGTLPVDTSGFAVGDPIRIDSNGDLQLASNINKDLAEVVGLVGSTNLVLISGLVVGFEGLTPGTRYFLGAGAVTDTYPTTDGYVIVKIGIALSTTSIVVDISEIIIL
jgi:hypothetical protein